MRRLIDTFARLVRRKELVLIGTGMVLTTFVGPGIKVKLSKMKGVFLLFYDRCSRRAMILCGVMEYASRLIQVNLVHG